MNRIEIGVINKDHEPKMKTRTKKLCKDQKKELMNWQNKTVTVNKTVKHKSNKRDERRTMTDLKT